MSLKNLPKHQKRGQRLRQAQKSFKVNEQANQGEKRNGAHVVRNPGCFTLPRNIQGGGRVNPIRYVETFRLCGVVDAW